MKVPALPDILMVQQPPPHLLVPLMGELLTLACLPIALEEQPGQEQLADLLACSQELPVALTGKRLQPAYLEANLKELSGMMNTKLQALLY